MQLPFMFLFRMHKDKFLLQTLTKELNLQHYAMGDKMGIVLAESISGLPYIQSVNIADNQLTDESLGPIMNAVMSIPNMLMLDVSENVTGPIFADLLAKYLKMPTCSLLKLSLRHADVDDFECQRQVSTNKLLKYRLYYIFIRYQIC